MTVLNPPAVLRPLQVLLVLLGTVLAAVLFAAGWTASKIALAGSWCATAFRLGWDDARAGHG